MRLLGGEHIDRLVLCYIAFISFRPSLLACARENVKGFRSYLYKGNIPFPILS